jgi:F-type H+-transporting ATPase subunit delta
MSVAKIANRYAKSLIDLSVDKNVLDEVVRDTRGFLELTANKDFGVFLKSPIIHADKKIEVLVELLGGKVRPELLDFFKMVVRKGREGILPDILTVVEDKYNEMKGVTRVVITSAVELSDSEFERIAAKLKKTSLVSANIEFIKKINPALMGGFVIEIGDKRYDASVAGKMKKLRNQLIEK